LAGNGKQNTPVFKLLTLTHYALYVYHESLAKRTIKFSKCMKNPSLNFTIPSWCILVFFSLFAFLTIGVGLHFKFGFMEEFGIHHHVDTSHAMTVNGVNLWFLYLLATGGRPIAALVYLVVQKLSPYTSLDTLVVYRTIGLIGLVLVAFAMHLELKRNAFSLFQATTIPLLALVSPAFYVHVIQGHIFIQPYAALLSYFGYLVLVKNFKILAKYRYWNWLVAFGLFFIAVNTYQPSAMFVSVFMAIYLLAGKESFSHKLKKIVLISVIMFLVLVTSYILLFSITYLFKGAVLSWDIFDRLSWFLSAPLSITSASIYPYINWISPILALASLAIVTFFNRSLQNSFQRIIFFFVLIGLIFFAYLPHLVSTETELLHRTMLPLSALLIFFMSTAFFKATSRLCKVSKTMPQVIYVLFICVSAYLAQDRLIAQMGLPLSIETAYLLKQLRHFNNKDFDNIVVIRNSAYPWQPLTYEWKTSGEIGRTNDHNFAISQGVTSALKENFPNLPSKDLPIKVVSAGGAKKETTDKTFLIDMREPYALIKETF